MLVPTVGFVMVGLYVVFLCVSGRNVLCFKAPSYDNVKMAFFWPSCAKMEWWSSSVVPVLKILIIFLVKHGPFVSFSW